MHAPPDSEARALAATGAILAALAVILGAFAAHALQRQLGSEELGWWHTATEYQMGHALGVLALGLNGGRSARLPAWLLAGGSIVFSATLYLMAVGAPRGLGALTPVGGLLMIVGWLLLAWRAWSRAEPS